MPEHKDSRKKTDESLTVERDKTNESISEARAKAEQQTDLKVESQRDEADKRTSAARETSDKASHESDESKENLNKERESFDRKIELERDRADAAILKERDNVQTATIEFLQQERGETDKNLKTERDEADEHEIQFKENFNLEAREHLKTKVSVSSRDDLIAILSHDLRNPIGNIRTAVDILAGETHQQPALKSWINMIKRNATTALNLIEDLFEMENIAQGKFELHLHRQNIYPVLESIVENFSLAALEKRIQLSIGAIAAPAEVIFDRGRMFQVFSNIVDNAIKFTPEGGKVTLALNLTADTVEISVRDTGPGIPADMHEIIFNRFSQIASKDRQGLGLGLFISKIFVEAHKGTIRVESAPGKGSTFYVSLNRNLGKK